MTDGTAGTAGLVQTLLSLPIFESEWVLWLLLGLSVASIAVMLERWAFYRSHKVDVEGVRGGLSEKLSAGDFEGAAQVLEKHQALETRIVLAGVLAHQKGPESVEDLISGALGREKARYEKRLSF